MIRLLHTADLHLDGAFPGLGEREPKRREDFLKTFERLVTLALRKEVHLFLVAGDLFDNPNPSRVVAAQVFAGLKRLRDRGIVPVVLPGEGESACGADGVYRSTGFPGILLDQSASAEPVHLKISGVDVWLYGRTWGAVLSEQGLEGMRRLSPAGVHIGMFYGACTGEAGAQGEGRGHRSVSQEQIRQWGLDYVALGARHRPESFSEGSKVLASYPGSPEGRGFEETGRRFCNLVTIDGGIASLEALAVNQRELQLRSLDLTGFRSEVQVLGAVEALGDANLLLRLELTGILDTPMDLQALQKRLKNRFFHLELVDHTRLFEGAFFLALEQENSIRGVLARNLRRMMETSDMDRRALLDAAFREVMVRFHALGGDA